MRLRTLGVVELFALPLGSNSLPSLGSGALLRRRCSSCFLLLQLLSKSATWVQLPWRSFLFVVLPCRFSAPFRSLQHFSEQGTQHVAVTCVSSSGRSLALCFTPRWHQGCVQSLFPVLAFVPCSSNSPLSKSVCANNQIPPFGSSHHFRGSGSIRDVSNAALRIVDSAVVVVDCIEGCAVQTVTGRLPSSCGTRDFEFVRDQGDSLYSRVAATKTMYKLVQKCKSVEFLGRPSSTICWSYIDRLCICSWVCSCRWSIPSTMRFRTMLAYTCQDNDLAVLSHVFPGFDVPSDRYGCTMSYASASTGWLIMTAQPVSSVHRCLVGFHQSFPLGERSVSCLHLLVVMFRLDEPLCQFCQNPCRSGQSHRARLSPD